MEPDICQRCAGYVFREGTEPLPTPGGADELSAVFVSGGSEPPLQWAMWCRPAWNQAYAKGLWVVFREDGALPKWVCGTNRHGTAYARDVGCFRGGRASYTWAMTGFRQYLFREGTEPSLRVGLWYRPAWNRIYAKGLWVVFRRGQSPPLQMSHGAGQHGTGYMPKVCGLFFGRTEPSHTWPCATSMECRCQGGYALGEDGGPPYKWVKVFAGASHGYRRKRDQKVLFGS